MTDREDMIKTSIIGEAAMMLARLWKIHLRPVEYNRIFYLDGVRVEVSISEIKDIPPHRRAGESEVMEIMSERSIDA